MATQEEQCSNEISCPTVEDQVVCDQLKGHYARRLTKEEMIKLKEDTILSDFQRNKLEREARKNWDCFYKRNETKFFKDRHWTKREFEQLIDDLDPNNNQVLIELGCGVGNFLFPLLQEGTRFFVYACDFSPRAIQFIKSNPLYHEDRCFAFVADLTNGDEFDLTLKTHFTHQAADIASLIFVLSAISPEKMLITLQNAYKVLRPGGYLLFRDYGLYDHAMLRFKSGHKIGDHFYVRQDGTRAYYFSEEKLAKLMKEAGFEIIENHYVMKETVNRKESLCVSRIFIQGKFRKPDVQ